MNTKHKILFTDSRNLAEITGNTVDLVVTSPPYPMIKMWDMLFNELNPEVGNALNALDGNSAFELMHVELDKVWGELERVVKPDGFVCINIGDATRRIGKNFQLYSNHTRITSTFTKLSFNSLPVILWKKATNAPTKFMGSGMLPAGAYVTLEHEYVLIFRKGEKREFKSGKMKTNRNKSAIFWEERNKWFSETWDLKGVKQAIKHKDLRGRNAAYPFELSYRIINMYSVMGDMVLDPFLGTGTTVFSAIASGRNSIGVEYDKNFRNLILSDLCMIKKTANDRIIRRINAHSDFVENFRKTKGNLKYRNNNHNFAVMTKQEQDIEINYIKSIDYDKKLSVSVDYEKLELKDGYPDIPIF